MPDLALPVVVVRDQAAAAGALVRNAAIALAGPVDLQPDQRCELMDNADRRECALCSQVDCTGHSLISLQIGNPRTC